MIDLRAKKSRRRARRRAILAWTRLRRRESVARALAIAHRVFLAAIVAFLLYRLSKVGWRDVLSALPTSPWFYAFFAMRFLTLPISEMAIYEWFWPRRLMRHFFVFLRKRVYNFAVLGYSGEAFFAMWARRRLGLSDREILLAVKDNNLMSAFASNAATALLLVFLGLTGALGAGAEAFPGAGLLIALAFISASALSTLFLAFRRRLLTIEDRRLAPPLLMHGARQGLIITLHAAMYAAALPGTEMAAWLLFIAMQLVLSRIPFLPNQDLVYLSAALALSPVVGAPEAAVAAMLIAEAGLSQIANATLFVATAPLARAAPRPAR